MTPRSRALSMMVNEVASSVSGPKFIVPRQRRLTRRPVRPRWVYSIWATLVASLPEGYRTALGGKWRPFSHARYGEEAIPRSTRARPPAKDRIRPRRTVDRWKQTEE